MPTKRVSSTARSSAQGAICNTASNCATEIACSTLEPTLDYRRFFFIGNAENIRIFAFEPSPTTCECLKANIDLHGIDARVYECGLSRKPGTAEFTFYPSNTVLSGFHADLEADRGTTKTYMVNSGFAPRDADRFLGFLFKKVTFPCRLRTLSEIVDEERVTRIDLLKVDAEKSEMDVLAGIRSEHWGLIRQVAIEVHDHAGGLDEVRRLLAEHGFQVTTEQDPLLKDTALFNVFAIRQQ